jgi:hypothetical protein
VGNPVCINGMISGSDCGLEITQVNIAVSIDGVDLKNVDQAHSDSDADCSVDGDSGGSVVVNHPGVETAAEATGVVSGTKQAFLGGCNQIFTGREEAVQAWGGGLNLQ